MLLTLDHLVVTCTELRAGSAHVARGLGQPLQPGGQHVHFSTHNQLLSLGPLDYLEVIAVDPTAPPPAQARWFDLDRVTGPPRLSVWALRTDNLDATLHQFGSGYGTPIALSRGDLRWRMAVPTSGVLPYDNCAPAFLEWETPPPAAQLENRGCALVELQVTHPEVDAMSAMLSPYFNDARVTYAVGTPGLRARITTPEGNRVIA